MRRPSSYISAVGKPTEHQAVSQLPLPQERVERQAMKHVFKTLLKRIRRRSFCLPSLDRERERKTRHSFALPQDNFCPNHEPRELILCYSQSVVVTFPSMSSLYRILPIVRHACPITTRSIQPIIVGHTIHPATVSSPPPFTQKFKKNPPSTRSIRRKKCQRRLSLSQEVDSPLWYPRQHLRARPPHQALALQLPQSQPA